MAVHFTGDQLEHAARSLRAFPDGVVRAAVPALNRASLAARTFGLRKLAATYTVKRSDIVRTVRMTRATRSNLIAGFSSKGGRMPLTAFQLRPRRATTKRQAFSVSVRRGSGGGIERGFVNAGQGGRLAALQREETARYPVRLLYGPAAPQMLGDEGVREEIEARATEILGRRFDHEIGRMLRGRGR